MYRYHFGVVLCDVEGLVTSKISDIRISECYVNTNATVEEMLGC